MSAPMRCLVVLSLIACAPRPTEPTATRGRNNGEASANNAQASVPAVPKGTKQKLALNTVTPNHAPLRGDVLVTLGGAGFASPLWVAFGGAEPVEASVSSPTEAVVVAPAVGAEGTFDVTLALEDGSEATKRAAFIYGGTASLGVQYCMLQPDLQVVVYAEGKTRGAGQGPDVVAELGYGTPGTSPAMYEFSDMFYAGDRDGIGAGDQSNDVYASALQLSTPGDYVIAARVRTTTDDGWLYCDLNGSPFELNQQLLRSVTPKYPQSCQLKFPFIAMSTPAVATRFYGIATGDNLSVRFLLDGAPVQAQWADGQFYADIALPAVGDARVSMQASSDDGAHWLDCVGAASAESSLAVRPALDPIDYCVVGEQSLSASGGSVPSLTLETYEALVTDAGAAGNALVVEAGYGPVGANPVLAFTGWKRVPFKEKLGNNYVYQGPIADTLAPGRYSVVARVRRTTGLDWTYCDRDSSSMDFRSDQMTPLIVE